MEGLIDQSSKILPSFDGMGGSGGALPIIRRYIEREGFAPGDRLPAERDLIGILGVTRTALRKALDILEREGRVWRHVGKGTFVANGGVPGSGSPLAEIGRRLTPVKMMRARLCIEPAIAREAALNASGEALSRIRTEMERAAAAASWSDYETHDDRFHRAIAEASDNLLLLTLFDQLNLVRRTVAWGVVQRETARPPAGHQSFIEHDAIAAAISARDSDAAFEAMRRHLRSVSARLFEEA